MQSRDPQDEASPPMSSRPSHGEYPDQVSRDEGDAVSTSFSPDTGRRTKRGAGIAVIVLAVLFVFVSIARLLRRQPSPVTASHSEGSAHATA